MKSDRRVVIYARIVRTAFSLLNFFVIEFDWKAIWFCNNQHGALPAARQGAGQGAGGRSAAPDRPGNPPEPAGTLGLFQVKR